MLTYRAMFKFLDEGGVHAEVIDFPGAITWGHDLDDARRMVQAALTDMAETYLLEGTPLPAPNAGATDPVADILEPVCLQLLASSPTPMTPAAVGL